MVVDILRRWPKCIWVFQSGQGSRGVFFRSSVGIFAFTYPAGLSIQSSVSSTAEARNITDHLVDTLVVSPP